MDRSITADEANERFPEVLSAVSKGESFVVTAEGRPVARVVPVEEEARDRERALDEALALLASLPRRTLNWRREDLYD